MNTTVLKQMVSNNVVKGVQIAPDTFDVSKCSGCILGKFHRFPFPKFSETESSRLLELVHSGVVVPLETPSLRGLRYFINFIDDFSKWTVMFPMRKKPESFENFKKYLNHSENHVG